MRCLSCNAILTTEESKKKFPSNPTVFLDLCSKCEKIAFEDLEEEKSENREDNGKVIYFPTP